MFAVDQAAKESIVNDAGGPATAGKTLQVSMKRLVLRWAVMNLVLGVLLFVPAGRLDIPMFWAYLLVVSGWAFSCITAVARKHPDLISERLHPGPGSVEKVPVLKVGGLVLWVAHIVIAALDVGRFGWSGDIEPLLKVGALVGVMASLAIVQAVMLANRFASSVLRLQPERGQYVVTDGPYRFVRHPMYSAVLLMESLESIALGSWWAMAPVLLVIAWVIRRTVREDRLLMDGLRGYREYAARVKHRLVPWVW